MQRESQGLETKKSACTGAHQGKIHSWRDKLALSPKVG